MGIDVTDNPRAAHDISLCVNKIIVSSQVNVMRVDRIRSGIIKRLARDVARSDKIIFQSDFTRKLFFSLIGKPHIPWAVIPNGSDIIDIDYVGNDFITVSRSWKACKRLSKIVKAFRLASLPDSMLYVAGNAPNKTSYPNIRFIGLVPNHELIQYYAKCKAMIHLCWLDSCPNAVVEAIAAGLPVITNNVGGTREIVEPSGGIVCEVDTPYDFIKDSSSKPPKINPAVVADAIQYCAERERLEVYREHVDINNVAKQYAEFIFG